MRRSERGLRARVELPPRMSDADAHRHLLDLRGEFGKAAAPIPDPQAVWQWACRHAFEGLDVGDREFVRAAAFFRMGGSILGRNGGEVNWSDGPMAARHERFLGRIIVLSVAYNVLYCKADQGRILTGPWASAERPAWPLTPLGALYKHRVANIVARPGLERWLGREIPRPFCGPRNTVWKHGVEMDPGPGFLIVIVRRGLHSPPPTSEIYPLSARTPVDAGDGVWLAEGTWMTKTARERRRTPGWLAWSYVPGHPREVEVLVRGATAAAALDRFWKTYDAERGTFAGRRMTPADRELAWEPPAVEFADIEGEDLDAMADLGAL